MSSMNPYIKDYFASNSSDSVSGSTIGVESGRHSSLDKKCLWGDWISVSPYDVSIRR